MKDSDPQSVVSAALAAEPDEASEDVSLTEASKKMLGALLGKPSELSLSQDRLQRLAPEDRRQYELKAQATTRFVLGLAPDAQLRYARHCCERNMRESSAQSHAFMRGDDSRLERDLREIRQAEASFVAALGADATVTHERLQKELDEIDRKHERALNTTA